MYHTTTRVLTVLELLQARGRVSGAELAARLEVNRRTVRRYVAMLQDLGIPVEAVRGPAGGYRLRPGFKLPPLMLTDDEALAVTLGLIAARRRGVPADPHAVEGALAKIERVLPEVLRSRLQAVQASVAYLPAPARPQPPGPLVLLLGAAVQDRRRVRLRYRTRREETTRDVDPYGVVSHEERWYVVGWCHLRHDVRVFRLDHVLEAEREGTPFTPPPDFDSLAHVLEARATAPWGWPVEVLLETTLEDARKRVPPDYGVLEPAEGGVLLRTNAEHLEWLARALLALERPFVVRRPDELRAALRAVAAQALALAERGLDAVPTP